VPPSLLATQDRERCIGKGIICRLCFPLQETERHWFAAFCPQGNEAAQRKPITVSGVGRGIERVLSPFAGLQSDEALRINVPAGEHFELLNGIRSEVLMAYRIVLVSAPSFRHDGSLFL
jgi:hypothetical protein